MAPKPIDKAKRKTEIALAALDLFAENGLDATSISDVAKHAGIGKGTVYEYFSSKEELILTAFIAWMEQMSGLEMTDALSNIKDPEERIRSLIRAILEPFMTDDRVVKIMLLMFQAMLKDDTLLEHPLTLQVLTGMRKMLSDILLEGVAQGNFKPEIARDVETIAINLFAYLDGITVHYVINKNDFDLMPQVDFYLDRLLNGIRTVH